VAVATVPTPTVRLGDVARVIDSVQNDKAANWFNGTRAMSVPVLREADANTVEVANRIKAVLPAFRAELPEAIDVAPDAPPPPPDSAPAAPALRCARHQSTGADGHFDRVKTPATLVPCSNRANSTSVRPP